MSRIDSIDDYIVLACHLWFDAFSKDWCVQDATDAVGPVFRCDREEDARTLASCLSLAMSLSEEQFGRGLLALSEQVGYYSTKPDEDAAVHTLLRRGNRAGRSNPSAN